MIDCGNCYILTMNISTSAGFALTLQRAMHVVTAATVADTTFKMHVSVASINDMSMKTAFNNY